MPRIEWDKTGERLYETGVEQGVLYPISGTSYPLGVPWNGLVNVTESPSGAEANPQYADNIKYLNLYSAEEFGATIECFTYPEEFAECDGSKEHDQIEGVYVGQQGRKMFAFCYKTLIGNDTDGTSHGYKLHLVYGCQASPSEKAYGTVNDSPEAITFSYEITTTPIPVEGFKPTSIITIDSTRFESVEAQANLKVLEDKLYGTNDYIEATDVTSENFTSKKANLYKKVGTVYTSVATATYDDQETYYYHGADAYLPMPAEVFETLGATA